MNNTGSTGEELAKRFLVKKGYRILAQNYGTNGGELDIVAFRRGVLVFAEVKTRSGDRYGTPAEAVDERKMARLRSAANGFQREQVRGKKIPVFYNIFFIHFTIRRRIRATRQDIIEVYLRPEIRINQIKNAF